MVDARSMRGCVSLSLPSRLFVFIAFSSSPRAKQVDNIAWGFRKTRNVRESVFYEGVKLYNSFPLGIRECDRLKVFKRELKDYIPNTIRLVVLIVSIINFFFVTFLHFFAFCILLLYFIFYSVIFCVAFRTLHSMFCKIVEKANKFHSLSFSLSRRATLARGIMLRRAQLQPPNSQSSSRINHLHPFIPRSVPSYTIFRYVNILRFATSR